MGEGSREIGMNPENSSTRRLLTGQSRRSFLALALGLPFARPGLLLGQGVSDATIAARVPVVVRAREPLADAVTQFRAGGSGPIEAAMQQYLQVVADPAIAPRPRVLALRWALALYISEPTRASYGKEVRNHHVEGSVTSFPAGNYKCNKLVADAYAVGAGVGLSLGNDWTSQGEGNGWPALRDGNSKWPPKANELARADWNVRSLTNARPLRMPDEPKASPELGDLICWPSKGEFGHVGLYVGKNLVISAKETGLEIGPIDAETAAHDGIVRIRKFNGSGR